jgi:hypothetical protein
MTNPESLDRHQTGAAQQALADAKSAEAIALRLEDAYIRYIVLANTGGMAACLSLANGLLGEKTLPAITFHSLTWPMWLFLAGLISGALIVSLRRAQATHTAEKRAHDVIKILREAGRIAPTPLTVFSAIERKALPALTLAINVLGLLSQFSFFAGAVWGLIEIGTIR